MYKSGRQPGVAAMPIDQKHGHANSQDPIGLCKRDKCTYGSSHVGTLLSSKLALEALLELNNRF
jgi:hypothetical protein